MSEERGYLQHVRLLDRGIWLFLAAALMVGAGRQMFMVLRNQYLVDLGLPPESVTSVQGFNSLGGLLIAIPAILIVGRYRAKTLLAVGTFLNAIAFAAQALTDHLELFRIAAFIAGIAVSLNVAMTAPFLMRSTGAAERIFAFSFHIAVSYPLAGAIGSLLSGMVQGAAEGWATQFGVPFGLETTPHLFGYRVALLTAAGLVLLALIPTWMLREQPHAAQQRSLRELLTLTDKKRLFLLGLPEMLIGFGAGVTTPFFNIYFQKEWGLSPQEIAPVFVAMFLVLFAGYMIGPVLVKRFGVIKFNLWTQILSLPFFVELALKNMLVLAVIAFILRQALMNQTEPTYKQFAQEVAHPNDRHAATIVVHASRQVFFTAADFASGYMIAAAGGTFTWVITATIICYSLSILLQTWLLPRLDRLRQAEAAPGPLKPPVTPA